MDNRQWMDSAKTLTDSEAEFLSRWVRDAFESGTHIDEIVPGIEPQRWLRATLEAVRALCATSVARPCKIIACFPLQSSVELDTRPIEWADLTFSGDDEPPSVHMLTPGAALLYEDTEEYRCPVTSPTRGDGVAYYRCFRPSLGIENGWEYSRAIYVEVLLSESIP